MKSTEAFYRHNLCASQRLDCVAYRIVAADDLSVAVPQLQPRTTFPAGIRLRMKAAIGGIVILGLTCRTHFERRHRGAWAIIRNAARDREPRAAIRTVDKRIAITEVGGIK